MNFRKQNFLIIFVLLLPCIIGSACKNRTLEGKIIVTRAPEIKTGVNATNKNALSCISGSQIAIMDPDKPSSVKILTGDFYSAGSPDITPDGRSMVFSAQIKENDLWQIWEMELKSRKYRQVIQLTENCKDPAYLPSGKIVFSKEITSKNGPCSSTCATTDRPVFLGGGYLLFTCKTDGTELHQITFHPHADRATSVLQDGRLLVVSKQFFPSSEDSKYLVIRPDGTKADLFYQGTQGSDLLCRAREASNGKIYFIESDSNKQGTLISISYNRPLNSSEKLSENISGSIYNVSPQKNGKLLVAYKPDDTKYIAIYEFDADLKKLGKKICSSDNMHILEAIKIETHDRAKILPSEVDYDVKTGLVLFQDINAGMEIPASVVKASQIEVMGKDSSMGIIKAEADGSIYLKIVADKPFRISAQDGEGNEILRTGWFWIRPNERRAFIGCRFIPEMAPENKTPLAVKKDPVNVPVHVSDIIEKEVELE